MARSDLRAVLVASLLFVFPIAFASECAVMPTGDNLTGTNGTSVCQYVLGYSNIQVSANSTFSQDDFPILFAASFAATMSEPCADAVLRYACALFHPPCNASQPLPPASTCSLVSSQCAGQIDSYILEGLRQSLADRGFAYGLCADPSNSTFIPAPNGYFSKAQLRLPSCTTYKGTGPCKGIVDYPVYLITGDTNQITQSEKLVTAFSFLNNLVPNQCANDHHKLLCYTAFPRCDNLLKGVSGNPSAELLSYLVSVPAPAFPSQTLCEKVQKTCGLSPEPDLKNWTSYWLPYIGLNDSCDSTRSFLPAFFPSQGYKLKPDVTLNAIDPTGMAPATAYINCPYPTVKPDTPEDVELINGGSCSTPCPFTFFYNHEFWPKVVDPAVLLVGSLSCAMAFISFALFIINGNRTLLPVLNFLSLFACLSLILPLLQRTTIWHPEGIFASHVCKNNATSADDCMGQSIAVVWSTLATISCWCVITIDTFCTSWFPFFVMKKAHEYQRFKWSLVAASFIWPILLMIPLGQDDQLGSDGFTTACLTRGQEAVHMVFWLIPLVIGCCGCVFMVAAFVGIYRQAAKVDDTHRFRGFFTRSTWYVIAYLAIDLVWVGYRRQEELGIKVYRFAMPTYLKCVLVDLPTSVAQNMMDPSILAMETCEHLRPLKSSVALLTIAILVYGYGIWFFPIFVSRGDFARARKKISAYFNKGKSTDTGSGRPQIDRAEARERERERERRGSGFDRRPTWNVPTRAGSGVMAPPSGLSHSVTEDPLIRPQAVSPSDIPLQQLSSAADNSVDTMDSPRVTVDVVSSEGNSSEMTQSA